MPVRFKVLATLFALVILIAQERGLDLFATWHAAAGLLGLLSVFSAIALWPSDAAADHAEQNVARGAWADRIEFEEVSAERRGQP